MHEPPGSPRFLLVVAEDAKIVEAYYETMLSDRLLMFSAEDQGGAMDDCLTQLLSDRAAAMAATAHGDASEQSGPSFCMVLKNSQLMATRHKKATLRRALEANCQLILIVTHLDPGDLEVFTGTVVCSARVLRARVTNEDIESYVKARDSKLDLASFMGVYRALRLAFGSLVTPSLLPRHFFSDDAWLQASCRTTIAQRILAAVDGQVDASLVQGVVDAIVNTVAVRTRSETRNSWELGFTERSLLPKFPELCVAAAFGNVDCYKDVPFDQWSKFHRLCQFMSQQYRLATWMEYTFSPYIEGVGLTPDSLVPRDGLDLHSPHALTYFSQGLNASVVGRANTIQQGFICSMRINVLTRDEMTLNQAVMQQVSSPTAAAGVPMCVL